MDPLPRTADLLTIPQVPELALFQRLLAGDGLHLWQWDGLVEQCHVCDRCFLLRTFKEHVSNCVNDVIVLA
jgi:hypothetical protein